MERRLIVQSVDVVSSWNGRKYVFRVSEDIMDSIVSENCFRFKRRKLRGGLPPVKGNSVLFESVSRMAFLEVTGTDYTSKTDGVMRLRSCAMTPKAPARW